MKTGRLPAGLQGIVVAAGSLKSSSPLDNTIDIELRLTESTNAAAVR